MGLSLTELLVEYLRSPLGLDEKAPRFSWQLSSDKKDTLQTFPPESPMKERR